MRAMLAVLVLICGFAHVARAEDLPCDDTTWSFKSLVGIPNNAVCVSSFKDPKVPGAACYISQARTGGFKSIFGLAEDPSEFSIACRQIGPIDPDSALRLPASESVYSERTSVFFKKTRIYRKIDKENKTLVYVAISTKIVNGSPANSVSVVPLWNAKAELGPAGGQPQK
jgi:CreA protein